METLEDFVTRVNNKVVNRKTMESLIKAGAFDRLADRLQLLDNLDLVLAFASKVAKDLSRGQTDLFGNSIEETVRPSLKLAPVENTYTLKEQLLWERELLGLYLSQHPLKMFKNILDETTVKLSTILLALS